MTALAVETTRPVDLSLLAGLVNHRRDQDQRMSTVLLRLELVSFGSVQAWNPSGGLSGEPDDKVVALICLHENPPHLHWLDAYRQQATDLAREQAIASATRELEAWTRRTSPRIEGKTLVDLILEDGKGFEAKAVAQRYGVDVAFVRRKRIAAGKDPDTGRPTVPEHEPADRPARARELRARNYSTRQIALILGCHQTQVMRWIRKTADVA